MFITLSRRTQVQVGLPPVIEKSKVNSFLQPYNTCEADVKLLYTDCFCQYQAEKKMILLKIRFVYTCSFIKGKKRYVVCGYSLLCWGHESMYSELVSRWLLKALTHQTDGWPSTNVLDVDEHLWPQISQCVPHVSVDFWPTEHNESASKAMCERNNSAVQQSESVQEKRNRKNSRHSVHDCSHSL